MNPIKQFKFDLRPTALRLTSMNLFRVALVGLWVMRNLMFL